MLQYARRKAGGGFNLKRNAQGAINRLMRNKSAGYGMGVEVLDNMTKNGKVKTPMEHLSQKMTYANIKNTKPKRYISLNM
jgi:hypothetical protein